MSFAVFRKYQKPLLWAAVIFSVLIFATFSGFGDLKALLTQQDMSQPYGIFEVRSSGATRQVGLDEFAAVRQDLNRLSWLQGSREGVSDAEVWGFIIRKAEAEGAGLSVADGDVGDLVKSMVASLSGGAPVTRELYERFWRDQLQFASAREMERFLRDLLLGLRWMDQEVQAAGVLAADEIYLRWRADHELFDLEAVVVADADPATLPDPTPEQLQKHWDDMEPALRAARFQDPRRIDLIYAWAPLAAGEGGFPDELLAAQAEPDAQQVLSRFGAVGSDRWPDATEPDEAMRAELARELKVIAAAQAAKAAFEAGNERTPEAFRTAFEAAGFRVEDPEGLLGSDEIKALPQVGNDMLAAWLASVQPGNLHLAYPFGSQAHVALVLVTAEQASRPLEFAEAHDKLLADWKESRRDAAVRDWRAALRTAARALPECAAAIQPLLDAAATRADEAVAALPADATEEQRASARRQVLDLAEASEIAPRVAEFEGQVWASVPRPEGARVVELAGVPKSYAHNPDGPEEATSVERLLKTNSSVFRLAVGAVSEPIRHLAGSQSAVVLVKARSFPPQAGMLADDEGLKTARSALAAERRRDARMALAGEPLVASRNLRVFELQTRGDTLPETPPDA